jgi:hypothetical protein
MPQREYAHLVALHDEPVQRDIAGGAKRNHQFTQITLEAPSDQRMRRKMRDRTLNRGQPCG